MTDNRTGLSAADLAKSFRDMAGDGSMEWVYTPISARVLLDAADMLDENARLRSCLSDDAENARMIMAENAKLRELVSELWVSCPVHDSDCDECQHKGGRTGCELYDRMRELGVEV